MELHVHQVSLALVLVLAFSLVSSQTNPYCNICKDHTMCIYSSPGKSCKVFGSGGVSASDKAYIVDTHNAYRRQVAMGNEKRGDGGPQPKASGMRKMYWDNSLATVAQRWADQCIFGHDACRRDLRFSYGYVGQNLYLAYMTKDSNVNWKPVIEAWYSEVAKFNPKTVNSYQFIPSTAHYTQIVWYETYLIGCARRYYDNMTMYLCNYGPAGNILTMPIYLQGQPCTKCPSGTRCSNNLCEIASRLLIPQTAESAEKNLYEVPGPERDTTSREEQPEFPVLLPPTYLGNSSSDEVASVEEPSANKV